MKKKQWYQVWRVKPLVAIMGLPLCAALAVQATDMATELSMSGQVHEPHLEHIEQSELNALVDSDPAAAFITAFEVGDELFEIEANELDGVGANIGDGHRFAKFPRMDMAGAGQWANHTPLRETGPNGQACTECHLKPFADGAGSIAGNNVRDPSRSGDLSKFITRQPPHVFGIGAKQLLAEEMTAQLHQIRAAALAQAQSGGSPVTKKLKTKGVLFGQITAFPNGSLELSNIEGVDNDLIVKPLQWKGVELNIRGFVRGAENNEIGLQATELVGMGVDGDFDGVVNEVGVGDITALTIYQAGQPRPVTKLELASYGLMTLSRQERNAIHLGEDVFLDVKCASCHRPTLLLNDPVFSEPSQRASHRDMLFPSGDDPAAHGLLPSKAITFDITTDMPDNIMTLADGRVVALGNFQKARNGQTKVNIFSDLKRHDLGAEVAEGVDEMGTGAGVFITQPLWGVGSTAPYMHDGRSPTIADAIMNHGGDAASSRSAWMSLTPEKKKALVAYVENNILLLAEEEEEESGVGSHQPAPPLLRDRPERPRLR